MNLFAHPLSSDFASIPALICTPQARPVGAPPPSLSDLFALDIDAKLVASWQRNFMTPEVHRAATSYLATRELADKVERLHDLFVARMLELPSMAACKLLVNKGEPTLALDSRSALVVVTGVVIKLSEAGSVQVHTHVVVTGDARLGLVHTVFARSHKGARGRRMTISVSPALSDEARAQDIEGDALEALHEGWDATLAQAEVALTSR